ncbi:Selenide, water dikinase [subsurface metagenome]
MNIRYDPNVMVGLGVPDDAGVYQLNEELALVQTVDFFSPNVDDPYSFGAIAAANALSDIYAMGGRPIVALNVICFPEKKLPLNIMEEILRGGADKAAEAGISIIGGHSLKDEEPKYGLCVTGLVHPQKIITNAKARSGDALVLTKPIGLGIINAAIKTGIASDETTQQAIELMSQLNRKASEVMIEIGVNACTDVTGFSLLGHLYEMTSASGVGAYISLSKVPIIPQAWQLLKEMDILPGTRANLAFLEGKIDWDSNISSSEQVMLCDAQTSGGLLIAVTRDRSDQLLEALHSAGIPVATEIGEIISDENKRIRVRKK